MRKLRDIFYINANFDEQYFEYYGMEFSEFILYTPNPLNNIAILEPLFNGPIGHGGKLGFGTFNGSLEIEELSKQDLYNLGNFCWIDYQDEETVAGCPEQIKAEILYLSYYWEPLHSAFFDQVKNNFVYLAHDDGWYCKLYCKDMPIFGDVIANKIVSYFMRNKKRKVLPLPDEIKTRLLELTKEGLLINFSEIINKDTIILRIIGKYSNMDEMYHHRENQLDFEKNTLWLEYKKKNGGSEAERKGCYYGTSSFNPNCLLLRHRRRAPRGRGIAG